MKATLAVTKLNQDLRKLKADQTNEKKALAAIVTQEKQILDGFTSGQTDTVAEALAAVAKAFALGEKYVQTRDGFDRRIAAEKKTGLALLPQAKPALKLSELNKDRVALGLQPLSHPAPKPASYGEPWKKGPGQLAGGDTSHYQSKGTFEASLAHSQFAAIKATEGTGYTDPTFRARWNELGQKIQQGKMTLRVAYCFLDKGNGVGQAKHFLSALGIHGKLPAGTRLALDWEAGALSSPQTLRDAANYIHHVTGLWPMVYTSASQLSRARAAVPNAPMWEAKWTNGRADHNVPFVQYSDGPGYDHDVFNGDLKALRRFAGFAG